MKAKDKNNQEVFAKYDLRADTLKRISKKVVVETKKMKNITVPVNSLFGGEEYIKVKKSDWNKIMDIFNKVVSRNHLLETYEKKIFCLKKETTDLTEQVEKLKQFVASRELFLAPKSRKQKLEEARNEAVRYNQQRRMNQ